MSHPHQPWDAKDPRFRSLLSLHMAMVGGTTNTVRLALFHRRRTGFQPVRADSASRLSANETTGEDACRPSQAGTPVLLLN